MFGLKRDKKGDRPKISKEALLEKIGNAWLKVFLPLMLVLFLTAVAGLLYIGYNSIYRNSLSDVEREQSALLEERKDRFQQEKFDVLRKAIAERKQQGQVGRDIVPDIFYTPGM